MADQRRVLQVFEPDGGGFRYKASFSVTGITPSSLCFLGDTLYAVGLADSDGGLVWAFDRSGRLLKRFGGLYRARNPLFDRQVSNGRIACDPKHQQVIFSPRGMFGEVRAYGSDGVARWRVVVTDFKPVHIRERPDRGMEVVLPIRGFHRLHSLNVLPTGDVVAQFDSVASDTPRPEGEFAKLYSIVLRGSDGALEVGLVSTRPILAAGRDALFSMESEPVPHVSGWRVSNWRTRR